MVLATRVHHFKEEGAMAIATIGIDLAKSVFHVHGRDAEGRPVFQKRFSWAALMSVWWGELLESNVSVIWP
jgi:hypothetical protein